MKTRLIAVAAALTLAACGCGADEPSEPSGGPRPVVLDRPWLLQFEFANDDAGYVEAEYLRVTPKTGEVTKTTIRFETDAVPSTLFDAAGEWAIGEIAFLSGPAEPLTVTSLTGKDDVVLDLTELTRRPEAWAFVPDRPGTLHVLDQDDTLVEYSLATKESRKVPLAKPPAGMEYDWYFSAADGMPVASNMDSSRPPDVGEFTPYGITPIDPKRDKRVRCQGRSYPFTDETDRLWDLCQHDGKFEFRSYDGKTWTVHATIEDPQTDLRSVLPAVAR